MKCCVVLLCAFLTGCTKDAATDQSTVLRTIETARARHDLDAALRLADRSLRRRESPDEFRARLYILKSKILREREGLESARAFLASVANTGTPAAAYLLKREQAVVDADLGRFENANQLLLEAIAISRSAGKPKQVAGTEVARSRILLKLDKPEEAQQCLDSAKRYGDASGDHSLDAYILQFAARIMLESNRFESAIAPLQASYQRFRDEKKPQLAAKLSIDLAWAYYRLGRLDRAQELYEQAERDVGSGDKHICLGHLGNIFYDRGDLEHAAANYKQAAELARNENKDYYSLWLSNLAGTLADEKQWKPAAQYISESLAIAKSIPGSIGLYHAMVNAGIIAAGQHDYTSAERQLQEVQRTPHANPAAVLEAYAALAKVYADTNRQGAAKRQFETALKLVDETRTNLREDEDKLSYLASLMKLHQQYVAFLMARGDVAGAFQVSEMSRARVLRDRVNLNGGTMASRAIADYRQAARASGAAYLVYWVAPEKSFLWVIDGASFTSLTLPGEARIRALVERHQRTLERNASTNGPDQGTAAELFDAVVEPARRVVPKANRFVIVPDGPLYGINFETLRDGSRYWIEDSTIAVAPSLELLLGKSAPRQPAPTALLIGDAVEWTPEFPKLLNASKELVRIGHQFPDTAETVLAGARATPSAFEKSDPEKFSYIHFAAHAVANRNSPLDSAIILSEGRLSVKDVLATPVRARLVTISACSSAGARTYSGEGLVGLAWAFLQSGAHGVVAGLWDVSDYSSPILMESLYAGLMAGKQPADALRSAKLKLLAPGSKYADPYYWGAFQLYLGSR